MVNPLSEASHVPANPTGGTPMLLTRRLGPDALQLTLALGLPCLISKLSVPREKRAPGQARLDVIPLRQMIEPEPAGGTLNYYNGFGQ